MAFDWKTLVRGVAPTLGTALGGPLAGMAIKAATTALLGQPGTEEQLATAMESATPEQLAALKKVDNDFAVQMKALDIDLEKIAAGDRDSARRREVDTHDSWTPRVLAGGVSLMFGGALWYVLHYGVVLDQGGGVVMMMLGNLGTAFGMVLAYYYGTTAGSGRKDAVIGKIATSE